MEVYFKNLTSEEVSTEKLVEDLTNLVQDAEELVKATGANIAESSKQELLTALGRLKRRAQQTKQRALASAKATDRFIRGNPYRALAVTFGIGMIAGMIVKRR